MNTTKNKLMIDTIDGRKYLCWAGSGDIVSTRWKIEHHDSDHAIVSYDGNQMRFCLWCGDASNNLLTSCKCLPPSPPQQPKVEDMSQYVPMVGDVLRYVGTDKNIALKDTATITGPIYGVYYPIQGLFDGRMIDTSDTLERLRANYALISRATPAEPEKKPEKPVVSFHGVTLDKVKVSEECPVVLAEPEQPERHRRPTTGLSLDQRIAAVKQSPEPEPEEQSGHVGIDGMAGVLRRAY